MITLPEAVRRQIAELLDRGATLSRAERDVLVYAIARAVEA